MVAAVARGIHFYARAKAFNAQVKVCAFGAFDAGNQTEVAPAEIAVVQWPPARFASAKPAGNEPTAGKAAPIRRPVSPLWPH